VPGPPQSRLHGSGITYLSLIFLRYSGYIVSEPAQHCVHGDVETFGHFVDERIFSGKIVRHDALRDSFTTGRSRYRFRSAPRPGATHEHGRMPVVRTAGNGCGAARW
jgi:hypothetical protein